MLVGDAWIINNELGDTLQAKLDTAKAKIDNLQKQVPPTPIVETLKVAELEEENDKLKEKLMESDSALKTLLGDQTAYYDLLQKNKELEQTIKQERKDYDLALQNAMALEHQTSKIIARVSRCNAEKALTEITRKLDALSSSQKVRA